MKYPKKFIEKVKKEFPAAKSAQYALLNKYLMEGQVIVGSFLAVLSGFDIDPETLILAIKNNDFKEIKRDAKKAVRRRKLYYEWKKMYDELWQRSN